MTEPSPTNPDTRQQRRPRRSLLAVQAADPLAPQPAVPDKLRFRIGEVARLCGVQTSVLRFWETEFPQLRPGKAGSGQRLFRRRDVETALRIRHLLYTEGYTIPGARQLLRSHPTSGPALPPAAPAPASLPQSLQLPLPVDTPAPIPSAQLLNLRQQLGSLHALLSLPPARRSRPRVQPSPERHASLFAPTSPEVR